MKSVLSFLDLDQVWTCNFKFCLLIQLIALSSMSLDFRTDFKSDRESIEIS